MRGDRTDNPAEVVKKTLKPNARVCLRKGEICVEVHDKRDVWYIITAYHLEIITAIAEEKLVHSKEKKVKISLS